MGEETRSDLDTRDLQTLARTFSIRRRTWKRGRARRSYSRKRRYALQRDQNFDRGSDIGHFRLPSLMAIGFISAFSETLASTVVAEKAVTPIIEAVRAEDEDVLKSVGVWTVGQIGKHTSDHAKAIAETGYFLCNSVDNLFVEGS